MLDAKEINEIKSQPSETLVALVNVARMSQRVISSALEKKRWAAIGGTAAQELALRDELERANELESLALNELVARNA